MDTFEKRVRAAAMAAWSVVGTAIGFLTLVWLVYLGIAHARWAWMLSLWGPDVSWAFFDRACLAALAVFKIAIWLMALASLWLTLWAKRLRKLGPQ
jgi:hypothetical protein